jgi:hypothetical protein
VPKLQLLVLLVPKSYLQLILELMLDNGAFSQLHLKLAPLLLQLLIKFINLQLFPLLQLVLLPAQTIKLLFA